MIKLSFEMILRNDKLNSSSILFGGHQSFLWSHRYPCFGLLVTSPPGFQSQSGSPTCVLCRLCAMVFSDSTSGTDLLMVSQTSLFIHVLKYVHTSIGGTRTWDLVCRFLPPANEVWGKVIFSEACVKNSVHRRRGSTWAGTPPPRDQAGTPTLDQAGRYPPGSDTPPGTGQVHPPWDKAGTPPWDQAGTPPE